MSVRSTRTLLLALPPALTLACGGTGTWSGSKGSGDDSTSGQASDSNPGPIPDIPPDGDEDEDGIPNGEDPLPNDPEGPTLTTARLVYAHTRDELFSMDPDTYEISSVGLFSFDRAPGLITDIAIDRRGVLYAISFNDVFVCDPETAACIHLGALPSSFNGLTLVPAGTLAEDDDVLVGIAQDGSWYAIDILGGVAQLSLVGAYGGDYSSSGDAFSILGVGTFASVDAAGDGDRIIEVEPTTGAAVQEVAALDVERLYGLAGWTDRVFGFDESGGVFEIDLIDGDVVQVATTPWSWWGAGVYTILPQ